MARVRRWQQRNNASNDKGLSVSHVTVTSISHCSTAHFTAQHNLLRKPLWFWGINKAQDTPVSVSSTSARPLASWPASGLHHYQYPPPAPLAPAYGHLPCPIQPVQEAPGLWGTNKAWNTLSPTVCRTCVPCYMRLKKPWALPNSSLWSYEAPNRSHCCSPRYIPCPSHATWD